jgi:hypothetical protein
VATPQRAPMSAEELAAAIGAGRRQSARMAQ